MYYNTGMTISTERKAGHLIQPVILPKIRFNLKEIVMSRAIDLTGRKYGLLDVITRVPNNTVGRKREATWYCLCDCGGHTITTSNRLTSGVTKSCGCFQRARAKQVITGNTYTKTHGEKHTRLYHIWNSMKMRTSNPNHGAYHRYGGRGIVVCDEWKNSFEAFRDWAKSNGYDDNLSIDRINNDAGYTPNNCTWVTPAEQAYNRIDNVLSADDVPVIRVMLNDGFSRKKIAELFDVRTGVIGTLARGQCWNNC